MVASSESQLAQLATPFTANDMLDVAKVEAGKTELHEEMVDGDQCA